MRGPLQPDLSESLHSLAVLAWMQGRHDDAETMLRDVLARRLQALGPDHLEVARARNALGAVLRRTGKLEECETLYRQAIATRRAPLGTPPPHVAPTRTHLAVFPNHLAQLRPANGRT